MSIEVKVPVLPESVADAVIATWHKKPGDAIKRDENLVDLETDKVVLEVPSPVDGILQSILKNTGDTVNSQQVIAIVEAGAAAAKTKAAVKTADTATPAIPTADKKDPSLVNTTELSPAGRRVAIENKLNPAEIVGTGRAGQVTKEDLVNFMRIGENSAQSSAAPPTISTGARPEQRVPMTRMRMRIAERLMQVKNSTAMLTSFNEINLKAVSDIRKTQGEAFEKAYGVRLGFMSFFVKAAADALRRHPVINASMDGNDVIYHGYSDISIAVATEKGLVTPVLRNAETFTFAEIEKAIVEYAKKAREGGLTLEDLQGGTFTITNGGTFGSLLSTPIINPPQSAILGMHTIKERAIVENGAVIAAPMMYVALSYDHRIIDGKDAVLFLVDIKNQLENPQRMLLGL